MVSNPESGKYLPVISENMLFLTIFFCPKMYMIIKKPYKRPVLLFDFIGIPGKSTGRTVHFFNFEGQQKMPNVLKNAVF